MNGSIMRSQNRGPACQSMQCRRGSANESSPSPIIIMAVSSVARLAHMMLLLSDDVLLAADHVDQVPHDVQEGFVRFLDARDAEAGDDKAEVADAGHAA